MSPTCWIEIGFDVNSTESEFILLERFGVAETCFCLSDERKVGGVVVLFKSELKSFDLKKFGWGLIFETPSSKIVSPVESLSATEEP